jgi:hypothetical protein
MRSKRSLIRNRKGVSPAVSTVIITAVTVVLVLVSGSYALQVLQSQRAAAEFDTVQKSILTFDDAVRDIAWDQAGTRSIRFTNSYGNMRLIDGSQSFEIGLQGFDGNFIYSFTSASVKYQMPYGYGLTGSESSYILGDESSVVTRLTDSLGQALLKDESGFTSITLSYRVRVSEVGSMVIDGTDVNYVYVYLIKLNCVSSNIDAGDFNLVCRNVGLETKSYGPYNVTGAEPGVSVKFGENQPEIAHLSLNGGDTVVFNLVVADVRVSY